MSARALVVVCALGAMLIGGASSARAQEPPREERIDPHRLREALARQARTEPPVEDVLRAALATANAAPSRARDVADRARLSGLLPTVRFGARRGQGWDLSQLQTTDAGRVQLATGDELAITGEVTFELDRLVYSRDEVALLREERSLSIGREDLTLRVVSLYYERRRLLLERALFGGWDLAHASRIEEIAALLNAFTGGAFGRMIAGRRGGSDRWRSSEDTHATEWR